MVGGDSGNTGATAAIATAGGGNNPDKNIGRRWIDDDDFRAAIIVGQLRERGRETLPLPLQQSTII